MSNKPYPFDFVSEESHSNKSEAQREADRKTTELRRKIEERHEQRGNKSIYEE